MQFNQITDLRLIIVNGYLNRDRLRCGAVYGKARDGRDTEALCSKRYVPFTAVGTFSVDEVHGTAKAGSADIKVFFKSRQIQRIR